MKIGNKEFTKVTFSGIDGKMISAYGDSEFTLEARPFGLVIKGNFTLSSEQELQDFAKLISEVWTERRRLRPKLATTIAGH